MSAARSLGNLGNQNALTVDIANLKVGIVSTSPVGDLQVGGAITMGSASGIITAATFSGGTFTGDGSALTGLADTAHVSTTGLVVVGVSTLSGNVQIPDSTSLFLGNDDDLELFHTAGGNTHIKNNTGELEIRSDTAKIFNKNASQTIAGFTQGASVGITTVGILTAYDSITVKVGAGSTELTTALGAKASTGKAIAMAMVFG